MLSSSKVNDYAINSTNQGYFYFWEFKEISEEDVKICLSEILKVNVFLDPYFNRITCTDPF